MRNPEHDILLSFPARDYRVWDSQLVGLPSEISLDRLADLERFDGS
jgi:hypothetical protein